MLRTRFSRAALVAVLIGGSAITASSVDAAPGGSGGGGNASTGGGQQQDAAVALVQLTAAPVAAAAEVDRGNGQRVDLNGAKTKSYRAQLSAQRNEFKLWLKKNAPKAKVTGTFDIAVNAVVVELNGTSLDVLRSSPLVASAQLQGLYYKTQEAPVDPDLALVNAVQAWGAGGAAGAGDGIRVAVIDSGIDQDHDCFDDMGDGDGANNFTNNKVVIAKVFYNKAANLGLTPQAIDSHGTHVAGTIACDFGTVATVDTVVIPHTISGVAPAARLGNYNVFPGTVDNARSEDILNALEAAFADGMDVANMSLGGAAQGNQDLLTHAIDNLDRAGMVVAVSAGNEGPGFSTVGSPGSAERALTAGASTVPHQVARSITAVDGSGATSEALAVVGDFGDIPAGGLSAPVDIVEPQASGEDGATVPGISIACVAIPTAPVPGMIAVIARNTCDFSVKIRNVETAGYIGAIVVNREPGAFVMGTDAGPAPTIPAVMIGFEDLAVVQTAVTVTLNGPEYVYPYGEANVMADFSSQGPTDVDRRIKPDVVAPGVNVLSSVPGGGFEFFNGTSMAAPHLAGAAAVVLGQNGDLSPAQVRSAIVNTANDDTLAEFFDGDSPRDPNLVGAGLLDVEATVNASVFLDRVSVSFGQVPKGAGKALTQSVGITAGSVTGVVIEAEQASGVVFTASTDGATITVNATTEKRAAAGANWATVRVLSNNVEVAHFRVFVLLG